MITDLGRVNLGLHDTGTSLQPLTAIIATSARRVQASDVPLHEVSSLPRVHVLCNSNRAVTRKQNFSFEREQFGGDAGRGEEEDMLGEEDMPPFSPSTDMRVSADLYICAAGCIFAPT